MRTLLILGGLIVCVLLVTPSNGDRTESQDGGGEKGASDLREFVGENEDGKPNGIVAGSSSAIDQRAQLRSRRDPIRLPKRSRRQEKKQEPSSPSNPPKWKKCPGCYSSLIVKDPEIRLDVLKRSRRQEKKKRSSPSNPQRRKPCPGCFSALSDDEPIRFNVSKISRRQEKKEPIRLDVLKRSRRQEKKNKKPTKKPTIKPPPSPPLANMHSPMARSTKVTRDTKPKRSKKLRVPDTDGLEGKPKSDRPSKRKSKKSEQPLPNMFALMAAPRQDFSTLEKTPEDEGRRERKKNGRKRGRGEKGERKLRKHHHHHHHRHHHHHPEGEKEEMKRKRTGSRSAITSRYGERKDVSDGKEVSERMKRQSGIGNKWKGKEERPRVGSRSAIASFPASKF
ncbi:uncharacterized protein [Aquarana catesbeiana]|uniref:uncharacterized protein isoform X3 n=1 Tax=Aquarana catesbeiana TaxID=8400 RepID=UPI003CC99237